MNNWSAPQRPIEHAEQSLVRAILDGDYPSGTTLPGERQLADQLGVTRPTLREALRRMERDGWLTIRQGKSTVVNDIWRDGGLNVLSALARFSDEMSTEFATNLLKVRLDLAPSYTRLAVEHNPETVITYLEAAADLDAQPDAFAAFDWGLHRCLTIASGNPIYTLILNGFISFYEQSARIYFAHSDARASSKSFYAALLTAAQRRNAEAAESITRSVMRESIELWQR
ncbi:MAG: fatty acid metabolism transcriptional regulator FadR [Chloroflexi bacterium]|nr:fatty acid metabolism transcriptional regulator FadR [Chloroflexota bacterium]